MWWLLLLLLLLRLRLLLLATLLLAAAHLMLVRTGFATIRHAHHAHALQRNFDDLVIFGSLGSRETESNRAVEREKKEIEVSGQGWD